MDTKFGMDVLNEMVLNAKKSQIYSFCRFWVIKGKPKEGVKIIHSPTPPTKSRVKKLSQYQNMSFQTSKKKLFCYI